MGSVLLSSSYHMQRTLKHAFKAVHISSTRALGVQQKLFTLRVVRDGHRLIISLLWLACNLDKEDNVQKGLTQSGAGCLLS
eukprot:4591452-Amphidinium_carterae.1